MQQSSAFSYLQLLVFELATGKICTVDLYQCCSVQV